MTKKLIWRLKESPTTEALRELVKDKILTNDEAREILFSSEEQTERDKKSLEEEIKFLRQLVEKLSQSRSQIIEVIKEVKVPYIHYQWYKPYEIWCGGTMTTTTDGNYYYNGTTLTTGTSNFSSVNTF